MDERGRLELEDHMEGEKRKKEGICEKRQLKFRAISVVVWDPNTVKDSIYIIYGNLNVITKVGETEPQLDISCTKLSLQYLKWFAIN